jgi:non-ribosomal peptide synthetase component F
LVDIAPGPGTDAATGGAALAPSEIESVADKLYVDYPPILHSTGRQDMQDSYEKKTLGALLDEAAARWSAREALTFESQRWSFAQLRTEVDRTARAFLHLGIGPETESPSYLGHQASPKRRDAQSQHSTHGHRCGRPQGDYPTRRHHEQPFVKPEDVKQGDISYTPARHPSPKFSCG